jgi:putative SOS response-associated peptidase YedK
MCGRFSLGASAATRLTHFNVQESLVWAKDPAIGNQLINARAETVATKPAFRVPCANDAA